MEKSETLTSSASDRRRLLKENKWGIQYYIWAPAYLKRYPVTEEAINKEIKLASGVKAILLAIHKPGEKNFIEGGFTVDIKGQDHKERVELDEAIYIPPRAPKAKKAKPVKTKKPVQAKVKSGAVKTKKATKIKDKTAQPKQVATNTKLKKRGRPKKSM